MKKQSKFSLRGNIGSRDKLQESRKFQQPEKSQNPTEKSYTFVATFTKFTLGKVFAKLISFLILTLVSGYFLTLINIEDYRQVRAMTPENFVEYYINLEYYGENGGPLLSTLVAFFLLFFLFGLYELSALMVGFFIKRISRR